MNIKKLLYIIPFLFLTSCEREIGELKEFESPRLVVNAMLIAGEESRMLRVAMTGVTEATAVSDANVVVSVNGNDVFSANSNTDCLFIPTNDIKPGDIVAVRASKGTHHASAQVVVPQAIEITGIDTMSVMTKTYPRSTTLYPHTRNLVHLRLPENMRNNTQYLRVEVCKDVCTGDLATETGGVITDVQYTMQEDHSHFSYAQDPALTENENRVFNDDSDMEVDWLEGNDNEYHVFRSAYFNDKGEYTLRIDLPQFDYGFGWYQDVRIRVFTISHLEYNYLQALTSLKYREEEVITNGEATMPSNITGGAGIFCVEALTEKHVFEDHRILMKNERW